MTAINDKAREVSGDNYADGQAQIESKLMDVHTALPAIIISFDADTRTVTAQPTVQRVFSEGEGLEGATNLPPCVDVPVIFPMGGGYELTFPIKAGDECLLIFAERCIDGWFESGQPTQPNDFRQHDLSDAFAIVGVRSLANKQPVWTDGVELHGNGNHVRIDDSSVELGAGGATLKLTASGLNCSVPITAPNVITDKMNINTHVHGGVESGGSSTGTGS
jgi:hypothetical protein